MKKRAPPFQCQCLVCVRAAWDADDRQVVANSAYNAMFPVRRRYRKACPQPYAWWMKSCSSLPQLSLPIHSKLKAAPLALSHPHGERYFSGRYLVRVQLLCAVRCVFGTQRREASVCRLTTLKLWYCAQLQRVLTSFILLFACNALQTRRAATSGEQFWRNWRVGDLKKSLYVPFHSKRRAKR